MKYPTLQKVVLTSMALVASLALTAQAGQPKLSSAKQQRGFRADAPSASARSTGHLLPLAIYQIDDGTMEDSVGFGDGTKNFQALWFNQFDVIPGQTSISKVSIAWGTPAFSDTINGTAVTVAVWSDPDGNGDPSDAVLLGSVAGTVQMAGTDTFIDYVFSPPIDVSAYSSFFVGDLTPANNGPEHFFQGIDENSTLHRQSWVAGNSDGSNVNITNPGSNTLVGIIDDFGLPGNWGIRADTGNATPTPTPSSTPTPTPPAGVLWYNGDFNDVNGLANERDTSLGAGQYASVYDDFNVTDSMGWDVTSVFSDNLSSTNVTGATWEIRQGVSEGNPGILVASGMTVTPTVTLTGRSGFGFTEYMVAVDGLSVHLAPGTYFLNVTPTGDLTGRSFDSSTSGANCVGTPCGNNQNAFFDSNFFGAFFTTTANLGQPYDFSMGVNGTVTGQGGDITLTAMLRGPHRRNVALSWTPANGGSINIIRDGVVLRTVADDGSAQDPLGRGPRETHVYQVCETDTGTCSNEVKVKVPGK